jgi:hypothetical protein
VPKRHHKLSEKKFLVEQRKRERAQRKAARKASRRAVAAPGTSFLKTNSD